MFDISEIKELSKDAINDGLPMPLKHFITGEETGAVWYIASYESDAYKAAERQMKNKGLKAQRTGRVNAEMIEDTTIDLLASLVVGWDGMIEKGKGIPFSKEAVKDILRLPIAGNSFVSQIDEFASDTEAFFKASQMNSPTQSDTR